MINTDENGKSLWNIVRTIGAVATVLLVLGIVLKFFLGVLFGDSIVEATIKDVSGRALSLSTRLISGQNTVDNEGSQVTAHGYPVSAYTLDGSFFEITLSNVPKSVCKGIVSRGWSLPTSLYINGNLINNKETFLCGPYNRVSFEFSRDLNSNIPNSMKPRQKHCNGDNDCSGCEACRDGRCVSGCRSGETCGKTLKGRSVCCADDNEAASMCCSFIEDGKCCWGRGQCCPKEKPIYLADGTCTDCYDKRVFSVGNPADLGLCRQLCPNRVDFGADDLCMLPLCQSGEFTDRSGDCIACSAGGGYETSPKECAKCSNRTYSDGWCLAPCPAGTVRNTQNKCVPCDEPEQIELASPSDCATCPNRELSATGCYLKECPEGFTHDSNGNCFDCQMPQSVSDISAESCALCPNRVYENGRCDLPCPDNTFRNRDGLCVSCTDPNAVPVILNELECQKCPSRLALNGYCFAACEAGQFRDAFGACHSCSDLGSFPVLQTAVCSICPNRSIFLHQLNNQIVPYCMLQYCPLDFFMDKLGSCHDCFDKASVGNTRREECEKCPNRQWSFVGETCRIKPSCSGGEIIDATGTCQSCRSETEAISVEGHPEECLHCSGRYLFGSWCRKCPENKRALNNREACEKCGGNWDNRTQICSER